MATIASYKISGVDYTPPRESDSLEIEATFDGDSIQPNINFSTLSFVNDANNRIKGWFNSTMGVSMGIPFELNLSNGSQSILAFKGHLDWNTYVHKSPVECQIGLIKENGLNGFSDRAQGITMQLLESKGVMPTSLGVNIPYVVENRKTLLENLQLGATLLSTIKSGIDEIFKLINTASDIPTGGVLIALANVAVILINLVVIIGQITQQLLLLQKSLFPLVRYFRGIKLKTFLEKGCEYLDYTIDFGTLDSVISNVNLCPSQISEEEGMPVGFLGAATGLFQNNVSGILRSTDFGYTLSEAFELCNKLFHTKVAIIGGVVHCKPFIDPYWTNSPNYVMPNILEETTPFYSNGTKSYNIPDIKSRTLIEYAYDDSDKHTISDVNNSTSETIVEPISVINQRYSTFKGVENIQIPYSLCVRKNFLDDLWDTFKSISILNQSFITEIQDVLDEYGTLLEDTLDLDNPFLLQLTEREGAMKVENHFFSTPKIVYLENGKIPVNFTDKIGANALYRNYHKFKSFVPGIKNPNNSNDTNQKELHNEVKIPFGLEDFQNISQNGHFTTESGEIGKFTSIKWNTNKDYSIVNYYIYKNYLLNIKETTL